MQRFFSYQNSLERIAWIERLELPPNRKLDVCQHLSCKPRRKKAARRQLLSSSESGLAARPRPVSARCDRLDVALDRAFEQLTRTADLVFRVADHLVQLGDPADRAGQCE